MKINRLLEITMILLNNDSVTAKNLADRFDVSTRTIYRDIDVLSSAGVPVYTTTGKSGGISLMEDYTLNKTLLSEKESEGLFLALKIMGATRYPETETILNKVGAIFKKNEINDWIDIDFAGWSSHPNERNKFTDIKTAIINKQIISFDYINANGDKSNRFAEPEKLIFNTNAWFLVAFCLNKNEHRMFRISRMKKVNITNRLFEKRVMTSEERFALQENTKLFITLKLRFSDKVLNRLYDDFEENFITKNDDGSIDVTVSWSEDEWVYGYILSFGNYVEVLEPAHIRDIITERMVAALKKYNK